MVDLSIVMLACLPEANLKNSHWKSHGETTQEDDLYDLSIPHMRTMVLEYESQHLPKKKSSYVGTYMPYGYYFTG
jgi:hypothetical protein